MSTFIMYWIHLSRIAAYIFLILLCLPWSGGARDRRPGGKAPRRPSLPPLPTSKLRVVTIQTEPYIQLNWKPGLIGNERYSGFYNDLLRAFADDLDIPFQLYLVPDGQLGMEVEGGLWTGLIGEITREQADMGLAPIMETPKHRKAVSMSVPISELKLTVVLKRPSGKPGNTSPPIHRLEELLNQSDVSYGLVNRGAAWHILRHSQDLKLQTLYRNIQTNHRRHLIDNVHEALTRVRRRNFALIMEREAAEYYIREEPCDLITISAYDVGKHYSFAFHNSSDWMPLFNQWITTVKANRVRWEGIRSKWWEGACSEGGQDQPGLAMKNSAEDQTTMEPARKQLTITTVETPPFLMQTSGMADMFEGYIVDLIHRLSELVPFDYHWRLQKSFGTKSRSRKGESKWSGMMGDLMHEEADLAAAPFMVSPKLERVLDFSKPFLHSTFSLLMKAPETDDGLAIFFLEDLLNQTSVQVGVIKKGRVRKTLRKSKLQLYKDVWDRIQLDKNNVVKNMDEGLRRIRNGNFALIVESTDAAYISSKPPCDLLSLDQFLSIAHYAFAFKKGNPLVAEFDAAMLRLQQDGELQHLFHKWWNSDHCAYYAEGDVRESGSNMSDVVRPMAGPYLESDRIFVTSPYEAPPTSAPPPSTPRTRVRITTTVESTTTSTTTTTTPVPTTTTTTRRTTTPEPTTASTRVFTTYRPQTPPPESTTPMTIDIILPNVDDKGGYKTISTTSRMWGGPSTRKDPSGSQTNLVTMRPTGRGTTKNMEWFFATNKPRLPDSYEEYDPDNYDDSDYYDENYRDPARFPDEVTFVPEDRGPRVTTPETPQSNDSSSSGKPKRSIYSVVSIICFLVHSMFFS